MFLPRIIWPWQKKTVKSILGMTPQSNCKTPSKQFDPLTVPSLYIFLPICNKKRQNIRLIFITTIDATPLNAIVIISRVYGWEPLCIDGPPF
jgi:hypothetical protein